MHHADTYMPPSLYRIFYPANGAGRPNSLEDYVDRLVRWLAQGSPW